MPIRSCHDRGTRDIAAGINSKAARKLLPTKLHDGARRRLAFLAAAESLADMAAAGIQSARLEGDREDQYAIRINDQYRICFVWHGRDAGDVEITDYH